MAEEKSKMAGNNGHVASLLIKQQDTFVSQYAGENSNGTDKRYSIDKIQ
jgi:hypothetical protein